MRKSWALFLFLTAPITFAMKVFVPIGLGLPFTQLMKLCTLGWQQQTKLRIRWRNEVVAMRRIRAVMRMRQQQWILEYAESPWITRDFLADAKLELERTRARYPWTEHVYAQQVPAGPRPRGETTTQSQHFADVTIETLHVAGGLLTDVSTAATLQAGVTAAAGGVAYFPPGYAPPTGVTINVPANTTLHFSNTTITLTASLGGGLFNLNNPDIRIEGAYNVVGGGFTTDIFVANSGVNRRLIHDAQAKVANLNVASLLFNLTFATNLVIKGLMTSTDCKILQTRGCQYQDVSGIQVGPLTRTLGLFSPVSLIDNGNTFGPLEVNVHDIIVDVAALGTFACVEVAQRQGGQTHGVQATIADIVMLGTGANTADGVDVVQVDQTTLTNVNGKGIFNVVNASGNVQVTGVGGTAINCRVAGLQIGDQTVAFQTNLASWTGFIAIDCGIAGQVDFTASGVVLFAPAASSTNIVTLNNIQSFKSAQANMKYGIGLGNGVAGVFTQIFITGGFYSGTTAPYLDSSTVKVAIWRNCPQITPQGTSANVVTPAFPATTVVVNNTTGFDIMAYVTNGASAMTLIQINGGSISGSLPANATESYFIPAAGSIVFVYPGGAPSWFWFGL